MNHPLLTTERTAQEIDFVEAVLDLSPGARVLDIGCGFGRHSIELARRGYAVTGLDPAAAMIAAARKNARQAGVAVEWRQEPAEFFAADALFDAAICLFTTLGQTSGQGDNRQLLSRVHTALKPGGQILVEVPQRETAVRQLRSAEKFGTGEHYTAITRQFDEQEKTITEIFHLVSPETTRVYRLQYRLFSHPELVDLLKTNGFMIQDSFGEYGRRPLADEDAIMLVLGEKN